MSTTWVKCPGPRRMPPGLIEKASGLCSECQTEMPIKRGKFVRHLVKLNGHGTPIAGSSSEQKPIPNRPTDQAKPKQAGTTKKRRRRKWTT